MTTTLFQVVFLISALSLVGIVLLQQSKSSGMGAFSGGSSGTVFGARGAGDFLYKLTRIVATVFLLSALLLSYSQNKDANSGNILERTAITEEAKNSAIDVPEVKKDNSAPSLSTDVPSASK